MSGGLDQLIGFRSGGDAEARAVLHDLAWGPFEQRSCHAPPDDFGTPWLRIDAVPTSSERDADALERALVAMAGLPRTLRFRIVKSSGNETSVFLTAQDPATLNQVRQTLTPYFRTGDVAGRPPMAGPKGAGVVFRLQADQSQVEPGRRRTNALLSWLVPVPGPWTVELHMHGLRQSELMETRSTASHIGEQASANVTQSAQVTAVHSVTRVSSQWQRVVNWTNLIQGHLTECGAKGGWATSLWATAADDDTLNRVLGAVHGAVPDRQSRQFWAHDLDLTVDGPPPVSVLSTADIVGLLQPPPAATPGLLVRQPPPAARRPSRAEEKLALGHYTGGQETATIGVEDLEGHAFVTGTTGSGKSTTLHRLLAEAWNRHRIPFLVLDPAKDDYDDLSRQVDGPLLRIAGRDLCMNIMEPFFGEEPAHHLAQIAQAFRGSFIMPSPTPYVVTQLFDSLAQLPGGADGTHLFDLRAMLRSTVDNLGYAAEARLNIEASLRTRLNLLLSPSRAHRFCWPDSQVLDDLFTAPAVVTLRDIPDDEERSFLVLLLSLATWSHARQHRNDQSVRHLLVLEEAHRVIPELGPSDESGEGGTAQRASADLLASMLAEVRSYGEQVIVVDQSPARVNSDVIRNTNLKVAHRITHPDERRLVGGALGLHDDELACLGVLARGEAVVSTRTEPVPQTVMVSPAPRLSDSPSTTVGAVPTPWPCECLSRESHYRAWNQQERAAADVALLVAVIADGQTPSAELRTRTREALDALAARSNTATTCLAWAGIRLLLFGARSSQDSDLADGDGIDAEVERYYSIWLTGDAVVGKAQPRVLEIAATVAFPGARLGLGRVGERGHEIDIPGARDRLQALFLEVSRLTSPDLARRVLAHALNVAVLTVGLDQEVAEALGRRSGLVQPK